MTGLSVLSITTDQNVICGWSNPIRKSPAASELWMVPGTSVASEVIFRLHASSVNHFSPLWSVFSMASHFSFNPPKGNPYSYQVPEQLQTLKALCSHSKNLTLLLLIA
jgi:hypothetical protein